MEKFDLDSAIRKVKDFPKEGILFYDITGILADPKAYNYCIDSFYELYKDMDIDSIVCLEARGFLFASPLAIKMNLPLILARKPGKLPGKTYQKEFALEYGTDTICIQHVDINKGDKILLIDDLIATGGTLEAARAIVEDNGAEVAAIGGVIGLPFLGYEDIFKDYKLDVLLTYNGE
ncbi:MAG: adenine phosphoribosyltransferase [Pleomorphochaeta sp.]|jgi:adenine phosphoribosyltransferase